MPLPLKKPVIICAPLFIAALISWYSATDNTRDSEAEPISKLTNNSAISSFKTTTDIIPISNHLPQITEEVRHPQTPGPSAKSDSYALDDSKATADHEAIAISEEFGTEEPDPHWAFEKENYYINLFSDAESLAGFVLSEAQCENNQCKLSFLLDEEKQKEDITNKLLERLLPESQELSVAFDLNAPSDTAVLYISTKEI